MQEQKLSSYFSSINEFSFINSTTIGKGSFGQVKLAFHLRTNKIYAIKIINIESITTEVGFKALENEINFHPALQHPHIIKLWEVIEEKQTVYLIMEYAENGNLFSYQNKKQKFSQSEAYIYFSQVLSAIKYLHSMDLMHRDLKPENLLLDKEFNIKICDFGWVSENIQEKKNIFCGTYEYMAPEMIQGKSYDYRVDIWALGILLYELLHGNAPFQGESTEQVKKSMSSGQLKLFSTLSEEIRDLIEKILKIRPQERATISQIENHPWIQNQIMQNSLYIRESLKAREQKKSHRNKDKSPKNYTGRIQSSQKKNPPFKQIKNKDNLGSSTQKQHIKPKKKEEYFNQNPKITRKMMKIGSLKNKENDLKDKKQIYMKQKYTKNRMKGHKTQKSQLSDLKNSNRVGTEASEPKKTFIKKKQPIRFNTDISETVECFGGIRQSLKKKKINHKKNNENVLSKLGLKYLRKSLEFC